ncbi:MAG: hypothetical protein ACM3O4_00980 [Ignavibacteriales bacterium]
MTSIGRYTLIVEEQDKKHLVPLETANSDTTPQNTKVDLATIDRYTTKFSSPQQLIDDLKNKRIIVNGYRTMYISYRYDGNDQKLEVTFSEYEQLREIAKKSSSQVKTDSLEFNKFLNQFLGLLDNYSFYHFLLDQKVNGMFVINDKSRLKDYIDTRYSVGTNDNFTISKIKEHISSYKKFRDIYLVFYKYNQLFERIFYFMDDSMFRQEVLTMANIRPQTKLYLRDYSDRLPKHVEQKIKEELSYSEFEELDRLASIYETREKEDELNQVEQLELDETMVDGEDPKEKYPEAYVEHRINPYSSYEEEENYQHYLDELADEALSNAKEADGKPKVKVIRRKKVDPRQLTLFDREEK